MTHLQTIENLPAMNPYIKSIHNLSADEIIVKAETKDGKTATAKHTFKLDDIEMTVSARLQLEESEYTDGSKQVDVLNVSEITLEKIEPNVKGINWTEVFKELTQNIIFDVQHAS